MRVKVGDDILDSFREEVIAQNYSVNQIGDITNRQGGFSNEFEVPLTAKNRAILGVPDDINSTSRKPYTKVIAELIDQGVTIATGYLRFQEVPNNSIKISFFSDNVEWFSLLKDKSLQDLNLSAFDHVWDVTAVTDAIAADKSSGFTYPLIDYGEFGELTSLSVESGQMYPAIFINTIVETIFSDVGWKAEGDMIDHPLFQRMIIPFSAESFVHDSQYIEDNTQSLIKPNTQSDTIPAASGLVEVPIIWVLPATSLITIAEAGVYNIRFVGNVSFVTTVGNSAASFNIENNGVIVINGPTYTDYVGEAIIDQDVTLDAGDIEVVLSVFTPAGDDMTYSVFLTTTTVIITPKESVLPGSTIQISAILPDIKQSDFLRYLAFVFGSVPQANNLSQTVNFGLFRSIKNNIPNAIDWSSKLDLSKSKSIDFTQLLSKYKSISVIKYTDDDNDEELSAYAAETGRTFGEGQFDIDNEHILGKEEIFEAEFSPMININSFDNTMYIPQIRFKEATFLTISSVADNGGGFARYTLTNQPSGFSIGDTISIVNTTNYNGTQVVSAISGITVDTDKSFVSSETGLIQVNGDDLEIAPKIAILSKNISVSTLSLGLYTNLDVLDSEDGVTTISESSIPFCWFTKTEYISEVDAFLDSLSFDQVGLPNAVGDPLKDRFLIDYEEILNSVKFVEAFFHLNETDINALDFLIPIFVDHYKAYFYISKINNYQGSLKTTEAELVKIADG